MKRLLPLACLAALGGCAPKTLQLPPTLPDTLSEPRGAREVTTLLDLDHVNDVAQGGGYVFVATDHGLLVFDGEGGMARLMETERFGAVTATESGDALAAAGSRLIALRGSTPTENAPPELPAGTTRDLLLAPSGALWACGDQGLLSLRDGAWMRMGEPVNCVTLHAAPQNALWASLDRGALFVDADDVVREHREGHGLPAGFVSSVVPVGAAGEAFALVQSPSDAYLAHFDGTRWFAYTVDGFERRVVGLGPSRDGVILFAEDHAFRVHTPEGIGGVRLTPLQRGERDEVLGYRATASEPTPVEQRELPDQGARRLAPVPPSHPTLEAPALAVEPTEPIAGRAYLVRTLGDRTYLALRGRGVVELGAGEPRTLSSRNLVADRDLQVASDERGIPWLVTDDGTVGVWQDGALQTVAGPEGARPWSVAPGPRGVYLASTVPSRPNVVQIHRRMPGDQWVLVVERTLFAAPPAAETEADDAAAAPAPAEDPETAAIAAPAPPTGPQLVGVPMLGVTEDEALWVALRVAADTESGSRLRGVAVLSATDEAITYHHEVVDPAVDGAEALRLPDDFEAMDVNQDGMAWFATLVGAIRLGNHQSVFFGEDRGVRGEVVSDVLVGSRGRVWVAAAEGPGYRQQQSFEFRMPGFVKEARPLRLAMDPQGRVWAVGPNGLLVESEDQWTAFGEAEGLPTTQLVDVEVDAGGAVWILAADRVLRLDRPQAAPAQR
ncbi:MAG: hypothetical protein CMN30_15380 [Sandaracinus sp.]|nr:hypothetical protein [Sandaracinus sp.]